MASTAVRKTKGLSQRGNTPVFLTMAALMIVVAITAAVAQSVMTSAERNQLDGYMSTGLGVAHEAVAGWINQQERMAGTWADSDAVSTLTGALLEVTPTRDALLASASHTDLSGLLTTPVTAMKYLSYSVVNKDGLVISSNGPDEMGMTWGGRMGARRPGRTCREGLGTRPALQREDHHGGPSNRHRDDPRRPYHCDTRR